MPCDVAIPTLKRINHCAPNKDSQYLHNLATHKELCKIALYFLTSITSFSTPDGLSDDIKKPIIKRLFNLLKLGLTPAALDLSIDEITDILLQQFSPESMSIQGHIFDHLITQMTPKAFLSDFTFDRTKKYFYLSTSEDNEDEYYQKPEHLTKLGILRKFTEIKNTDIIYQELNIEYIDYIEENHKEKRNEYITKQRELEAAKQVSGYQEKLADLTAKQLKAEAAEGKTDYDEKHSEFLAKQTEYKEDDVFKDVADKEHLLLLAETSLKLAQETLDKKEFISIDTFLAVRRYSTNFYRQINGELRFKQQNNCSKYIELINRGLFRLCTIPMFQLKDSEHLLTRHLTLPSDVLSNLVDEVKVSGIFKDKALLSTSFKDGGADEFAKDANLTVHIFTNGDTLLGVKLGRISVFPNESEFLYLPNVEFKVKKVTFDSVKDCWHMDVEATTMQNEVHRAFTTLTLGKRWIRKTKEAHSAESKPDERISAEVQTQIAKTLLRDKKQANDPPSFAEIIAEHSSDASESGSPRRSFDCDPLLSPVVLPPPEAMSAIAAAARMTRPPERQEARAHHSTGVSAPPVRFRRRETVKATLGALPGISGGAFSRLSFLRAIPALATQPRRGSEPAKLSSDQNLPDLKETAGRRNTLV